MRSAVVAMSLLLFGLPVDAARRRAVVPTGFCDAPGAMCLAFVSGRDGNAEIYVAGSDGTGLTRLTNHPADDLEPAWSPDGKRIAFTSNRASDADIYIMQADGSGVVRITAGGSDRSPSWSPDGTSLAFSSMRDGFWGVYTIRLDGNPMTTRLVSFNRGWNEQGAWSPEGQRIAFISDWRAYDFLTDVYVVNADGSDPRLALAGPFGNPMTFYFHPAWSPDGQKLAAVECIDRFSLLCYPDSSIIIANADGSGSTFVARTRGQSAPAWSPDGTMIAFERRECPTCAAELRYVKVDGSETGVISENGSSPAWRPR